MHLIKGHKVEPLIPAWHRVPCGKCEYVGTGVSDGAALMDRAHHYIEQHARPLVIVPCPCCPVVIEERTQADAFVALEEHLKGAHADWMPKGAA